MQIAQRCILIIGLGIMLGFFASVFFEEKRNNLIKDWEAVQTERFINQICRTGKCSQEEYMIFLETLGCSGGNVGIQMEEYKTEQDLSKKRYYPLVSWEEIKEFLSEEGRYIFSENSIVLLKITRQGQLTKRKSRWVGWVIGDEGNDT